MGKRKELTETERSQIDLLARTNPDWTKKAIANAIGRSPQTIGRYLNDPQAYGRAKRPGQPKVTTARDDRLIKQKATINKMSLGEIRDNLNLECCRTTIWNRLNNDPNVKFGKHKSKPVLTSRAKQMRLDFAIEKITWPESEWDKVIWTDEKRWCLDGPDGLRSYWYDLRSEKTVFAKRHSGGGSVQIWAGVSTNGLTDVVFTPKKMNSDDYQEILGNHLLPQAPLITAGDWILMQDNAPPHRSESTRSWLSVNEVKTMAWPPYSPDLNPIENLWGWLVRKVYENGKQFSNISDLRSAIVAKWAEVPSDLIKSLVRSVPNRLIKVIQARGGSINY